MQTDNSSLILIISLIACLIILGLAGYAIWLIRRVKQQQIIIAKHNKRVIDKRNATIAEHVHTLCMAGIGQQCDLSEIVIRVYNLMDHVQGCKRVDFASTFPASNELYQIVKDMAIGEARQALEKQQRMQQNLTRQKAEARLNDDILQELEQIKKHIQPWKNQIPVTMTFH